MTLLRLEIRWATRRAARPPLA